MAKNSVSKIWDLVVGGDGKRHSKQPDVTAPTIPQGVQATAVVDSGTQILITWNASTDTQSAVAKYIVERSSDGIDWSAPDQETVETSFTDSGLTPSTLYYYRVRAVDAEDNISDPSTVVSETTNASGSSPFADLTFPRLATQWSSGVRNYHESPTQQLLAKFDIIGLHINGTWQSGKGVTVQTVLQQIKANMDALRPGIIYNYTIGSEYDNNSPTSHEDRKQKINDEDWWVYPSGGSGTPVDSGFQDFKQANFSDHCPVDANGDNWTDWYTQNVFEKFVNPGTAAGGPCTEWDCWFEDNVFYQPRCTPSGDWNRDGSGDSNNSATARAAVRLGKRRILEKFRALMPGKLFIGNIADWYKIGYAGSLPIPNTSAPDIDDLWDGGISEGLIGFSYSTETFGSWELSQAVYKNHQGRLKDPKLVIFHGNVDSATDYQIARYILCSALMRNGWCWICANESYQDPPWFDEYDKGFDETRGYLGMPVDAEQEAPWLQGVWRREFDHGFAFVNPKGNGQQTVSLGTTLHRIFGSQTGNSGAAITQLTLPERSGAILLKQSML